MEIIQRVQAPTPKFFRVLRTIGIALASAGGALLAAPIALPAALLTAAGYLAVAGTVLTAVSQTAVEGPPPGGDSDAESTEPVTEDEIARHVNDA